MDFTKLTFGLSALTTSLVAGFLFALAVVVMPGLRALNDHDSLNAFKVMDRIIQDNQPLFVAVWLGSVLATLAAAGVAIGSLQGTDRALAVLAGIVYLVAVQGPTLAINVPLNNKLQSTELTQLDAPALRTLRTNFDLRWNRANCFRTLCAVLVALLWIVLCLRR